MNSSTLFTMSSPSAREILQLYRNLLRYGKQLKHTDRKYFQKRVREEFNQNKDLTHETDIQFNFKVSKLACIKLSYILKIKEINFELMFVF